MNKKTFTSNKRKAFSLIELSIVLIIIGLLIAGVTGGASLIRAAELRKISDEARGYQTAVNGFYGKYGSLPGDFGTALGTSGSGNNDGAISYLAAITGATNKYEGNIAWRMLKNDGFITDIFTAPVVDCASATDCDVELVAGTNVPASSMQGAGWSFDNISIGLSGTGLESKNVIIFFAGTAAEVGTITDGGGSNLTAVLTAGASASATNNSPLTPSDALSIDIKYDDGLPFTGQITNAFLGGSGASGGSTGTCAVGASAANAYNTTNAFKACALAFVVDSNS